MHRIQAGDWIENPMAGLKVRFTVLPNKPGARGMKLNLSFSHLPARALRPCTFIQQLLKLLPS